MLRIRHGCPLSVRGLETGVRNGKDQPASWFENPSDALKGGLKIRNIDQSHDTDTAGKLTVAQPISTLSVSLHIHNSQWLLLLIALCECQQVRCQVKTSDLRSAPCQLTCNPALPAGQITDDFPFDLSDERQQVWQDHFRVDRPLAQILIIPLCDIIVRSLCHSSLLARWRLDLLLVIYHLHFVEAKNFGDQPDQSHLNGGARIGTRKPRVEDESRERNLTSYFAAVEGSNGTAERKYCRVFACSQLQYS